MSTLVELLAEIRALEEALHRKEVRRSRAAVEALLAGEFVEFGSSGRIYRRHELIDSLVQEDNSNAADELRSFDYSLQGISADAVLLTYRTSRSVGDGAERQVLRSSIWKRSETGWKMLFHQGTVIT